MDVNVKIREHMNALEDFIFECTTISVVDKSKIISKIRETTENLKTVAKEYRQDIIDEESESWYSSGC